MSKEFVLAISEHRKFGPLFISYVITPSDGDTFYSSIERANLINVREAVNYSDKVEKIQSYIQEYDDSQIANFFTKKKEDAVLFIKNVDGDIITNRIRPFIERRLHKIVNLIDDKSLRLYFKDKSYSKIYSADQIFFADNKAQAVFNFTKTDDGLEYFLDIHHENEIVSLKSKKSLIITQEPCVLFINNRLYQFRHIDDKKLRPFFTKKHINIPKQTEKAYFEKFVYNSILNFKVKAKGFDIIETEVFPKPKLYFQNSIDGTPSLLLKYDYGNKLVLINSSEKVLLQLQYNDDDVTFYKIKRQLEYEKEICNTLKQLGLQTKDQSFFYLHKDNELGDDLFYETINWINNKSNRLTELGFEVRQGFFNSKYYLSELYLQVKVQEENDWFDVRGTVQLGEFSIPFIRLRRNILNNIREFNLPNGNVAILPLEWFFKYKDMFAFAESNSESLKLNKVHFQLLHNELEGTDYKKYKNLEELFQNENEDLYPVPEGVNAQLRPYQQIGFNWMNHLRENNFGGCLADDMGLGKTLQTLTLLMEVSKTKIEIRNPVQLEPNKQLDLFDTSVITEKEIVSPTSLIVMPASLIHNWDNEIKKFTPKLKVLCHTGNQRTTDIAIFCKYDIVLTTYGVIRNDSKMLSKYMFHYLILDESQAIKNSSSVNYKSIIGLKSLHRLALTGTPIENSLTDLWAQINFVNRGLLGNLNYFKKEFVTPIEKFKSKSQSEKLQLLIHPFVLRRTKDQVAKDLPSKTEQIRICEMDTEQQKMYEKEKSIARNNILENVESNGAGKSSFLILESLMKLRQLANHPKLIGANLESGKFAEVTRMLHNVLAEGHKVLIFSSFVKHLSLYEGYLNEMNVRYSLLTGSTKNRQEVIDDFQNNDDNQVFLISLKAGGVGLNLTAADYVFLLEPWWNPASENQAINRAHRIGQDKNVFVYRFISKGTIEEKIIQLQERKSNLADAFVNSNNPFKSITKESIEDFFD